MQEPQVPRDEVQRLQALRGLEILDTPPEERFDRMVRVAQRYFQVPIALVSLVDENREWFKSKLGVDVCEAARVVSFCGHAILSDEILYVPDTLNDARFADNPLVIGHPHIRFYAGAPLHAPNGQRVGSYCIIDDKPRSLAASELAVLRDLADCVEAELGRTHLLGDHARLAEKDRRLQQVVEVSPGAVYACKAYGDFGATFISAQSESIVGYPPEKFIDESSFWIDHVHPDDRPRVLSWLEEIIKDGDAHAHEYRFLHGDGSYRWMHDELRVMRNEWGEAEEIVGLWMDITERKKAEIELNEHRNHLEKLVEERTAKLVAAKQAADNANLAKSRFLAAASHDLRQPAQSIMLFCAALSDLGLNERQKQIGNCIARSAKSLMEILDTLLDIAKLQTGKIVPEPRLLRVDDVLDRIDAEFRPLARAKGLRLQVHFPGGAMAIFTDGDLLIRLLANLVGNAIKYTENGGVLVGVRRRGSHAVFQVWDSGIGIAPEHVDRIFDEYFQVRNLERNQEEGLGLGLSIAQALAQLLDAELTCRSRPGKGSVFEFSLPLADASGQGEVAAEQLAAEKLSGYRLVIIDDNRMVVDAMRLLFEVRGMRVVTYGSGQEALASADIADADFYISDLGLPGMNGIELLDAIQARAAKPIKAVVLTGNTFYQPAAEGQAPRWKMLLKPIDLPKLLAEIEAQNPGR